MKSQVRSSYCVMSHFWWGSRGNLKLITLGNGRVNTTGDFVGMARHVGHLIVSH